jgi:uncharacterized membrane protein HdeD (DUF308 family)
MKRGKKSMAEITKELKYVILAQAIVYFIFGIWFFFAIESYVAAFQWPYLDPIAGHYIGAFMLTSGVINLLIFFKETEWDKIEWYLMFQILFLLIGLVAQIWGTITDFTLAGVFNTILHCAFFAAFTYFYIQAKK